MKNLILVTVALLLFAAGSALAGTGAANIKNTPHNLSFSSYPTDAIYTYAAGTAAEDQICIYCHTPHGGTLDAPLWNRDLTGLKAKSYDTYVGAEMAKLGIATSRTINPESLTCLSCHDGSIGVGDVINTYGDVAGAPTFSPKIQYTTGVGPGPKIGASLASNVTNDLRDDHPISFSYSAVWGQDNSKLQTVGYVEGKSLVLFGVSKNVECATCHDPHVDYFAAPAYDPFLAIPNAGSDLCLSCHIK